VLASLGRGVADITSGPAVIAAVKVTRHEASSSLIRSSFQTAEALLL